MNSHLFRRAALCAAALSLLAVPGAQGQRPTKPEDLRPTQLLSRTPGGNAPNAPATEAVISQDERISKYAAYVSAATDIVSGSGAARNVYLVKRKSPWGKNGTAWNFGSTTLVSRGRGGPANGDSWGPALSGSDFVNPHCMAFVSGASNLVAGDTNGRADVFYRKLPTGRLTRIAGTTAVSQVNVDGVCQHVAYVAGGSLYLKTLGGKLVGDKIGTRKISGGGVTNPHLAVDGRALTYERGGWIYAWTLRTRKLHRIAQGTNHSADSYGRYVAFSRGTSIMRADIQGSPKVRTVKDAFGRAATGTDPSMTGGGGWVWYAEGIALFVNIRRNDQGRCPAGEVQAPNTSPHGNYAVFNCSDGPAYLLYEGKQ